MNRSILARIKSLESARKELTLTEADKAWIRANCDEAELIILWLSSRKFRRGEASFTELTGKAL